MASITLKQVATRAGVSHQTVSNVLNGVSVKPETSRRVHSAIRELDYHPNFAAKALRGAKSQAITLAFFELHAEDLSDPYRNLVQGAIMQGATERGYSMLSTFVERSGETTFDALEQLYKQKRMDGLILVGLRDDPSLLEQLRDTGIPVVLCDYSGDPGGFPTVAAQYADGMQQLIEHLVGLGKRDLVLLSTPGDFTTVRVREERFLAATRAHGIQGVLEWVDQSFAAGEDAFRNLWASDQRPDAILTITDRIAVGCLAAARELGVRVPEDVAIAGFDDDEFSRYVLPGLTTVRVPFAEMARAALKQLLCILEDAEPMPLQHFAVTFMKRQSA